MIVGVVGFLVSRAGRAAADRADASRRHELATWEHEEREHPFLTTWTVHFPTMRMVVTFELLDEPSDHAPTEYVVRRTKRGWRMKLTDASYRAELERAHAAVARDVIGAESTVADLEAGNKWRPMPEERFPGLDPAYERYVWQV
ncbi:MAG: hypothetical protein IPF92_12995 [Myxococcales bacterium]|nr:hypothetical protein [Myxococcales bacterium]